jgi:hypothetical protein
MGFSTAGDIFSSVASGFSAVADDRAGRWFPAVSEFVLVESCEFGGALGNNFPHHHGALPPARNAMITAIVIARIALSDFPLVLPI